VTWRGCKPFASTVGRLRWDGTYPPDGRGEFLAGWRNRRIRNRGAGVGHRTVSELGAQSGEQRQLQVKNSGDTMGMNPHFDGEVGFGERSRWHLWCMKHSRSFTSVPEN
jgi:hypothetical protein